MGDSSGTNWSTLTRTNYGEWSMTMKVKLRARRLWNAVDKGTDNEEDNMSVLEAICSGLEIISMVGRLTVGQQVVSEPYKRRRHSNRWR